jgi:hypothetical protein
LQREAVFTSPGVGVAYWHLARATGALSAGLHALARRKYVVSPRDRESTRFPLHVSISSAACQESLQVRSAGAIQDPDNELTDPSTHS